MDARKSRYSSSTQQEMCWSMPPRRFSVTEESLHELQDGHARVAHAPVGRPVGSHHQGKGRRRSRHRARDLRRVRASNTPS